MVARVWRLLSDRWICTMVVHLRRRVEEATESKGSLQSEESEQLKSHSKCEDRGALLESGFITLNESIMERRGREESWH